MIDNKLEHGILQSTVRRFPECRPYHNLSRMALLVTVIRSWKCQFFAIPYLPRTASGGETQVGSVLSGEGAL
jgi:hypothetical protein